MRSKRKITVALALITKGDQALLGMRAGSAHQGGLYEFLGGKCEATESPTAALKRECLEELGIQITQYQTALRLEHSYPELQVELHCFWVTKFLGSPQALQTESLHWVTTSELPSTPMPKANALIQQLAALPRHYAITPGLGITQALASQSQEASKSGATHLKQQPNQQTNTQVQLWLDQRNQLAPSSLVYVRLKSLNLTEYVNLFRQLAKLRADLRLVCEARAVDQLRNLCFGAHLSCDELMQLKTLPDDQAGPPLLWFASTHSAEQVAKANQLGVSVITVAPVFETPTHPEAKPLGLSQAARLAELSTCTVFALGGVGPQHLDQLSDTNFYGVAGIRHF